MGNSGQEPSFRVVRAELDPEERLGRGLGPFGKFGQRHTDGNTRTPEVGANKGLDGSRNPIRSLWCGTRIAVQHGFSGYENGPMEQSIG
jgi:hypothetical protein